MVKERTTEDRIKALTRRIFKLLDETEIKSLEYNHFNIELKKKTLFKLYRTSDQIILSRENIELKKK